MPEYNISWINSVTADSPDEAARLCRDMLLDPANVATFFHVTDEDGNTVVVDTLVPAADNDESVKCEFCGVAIRWNPEPPPNRTNWEHVPVRDDVATCSAPTPSSTDDDSVNLPDYIWPDPHGNGWIDDGNTVVVDALIPAADNEEANG